MSDQIWNWIFLVLGFLGINTLWFKKVRSWLCSVFTCKELKAKVAELEGAIRELERKFETSDPYEICVVGEKTVFKLKNPANPIEETARFCPSCRPEGEKSILQCEELDPFTTKYFCSDVRSCRFRFTIRKPGAPVQNRTINRFKQTNPLEWN
ncbi:MAG: hypothetical protein LBC63_02985 [Holophagales bacterium]|jgi:hypothetical protein|nr:hypothetical protein [Holophagales bacterium]